MAKKKIDENNVTKIDFSDKSLGDIYEGIVCLALKLDRLIEVFDKVDEMIDRRNGK